MRVLITGSGSQLTGPLTAAAEPRGHEVAALSHADLDIRDLAAARDAVAGYDAVVNLAAANSVDACEADPILAYGGNTLGPLELARAAREAGAAFVHFSTDFVFGGGESLPDYFSEDDAALPVNVYGHSKFVGEEAVLGAGGRAYVLRTSWVIGERFLGYVRSAIESGEMRIPPVGHACPAIGQDLVAVVLRLLEDDAPAGRYHVANPPATDRPALLRAIIAELGGDPEILVIGEDTRPAARPLHSALGVAGLAKLGIVMPDWHESLARFVAGESSTLLT